MVAVLIFLDVGVGIYYYCHCSGYSGDGYHFEISMEHFDELGVLVVIQESETSIPFHGRNDQVLVQEAMEQIVHLVRSCVLEQAEGG